MDLYNAPFNLVHELYYCTFMIKEAREAERKEQEKKEAETKNNNKPYRPKVFTDRLSPAYMAKEINEKKSQDDAAKKTSEGKNEPIISSPPNTTGIDVEDFADLLEGNI